MYAISKDTKNAKIIKKIHLEGGAMAFITGHACQTKMSNSKILDLNETRTMFLHRPSLQTVPFSPRNS